jgi:hypothetical protein
VLHKWHPGEAESRRPKYIVKTLERPFLINEDRLIVRLIGVMAYLIKRSGQTREAVCFADEIRLMFRADPTGTPFILCIDPQVIPRDWISRAGLESLEQLG